MDVLTIGSFVFFTGLVGLVTYLLTRGDDHESPVGYFLAGRRLTGGVIAGSLLLTNLSTEQLVGINGQAFTDGLSVMAWEVIAAVALVAMALFFLPRYLKSGVATLPQFLEERFDTGTRTIATLIFIAAYATILLPTILYSGAIGLSGILNLSELTGISSETGVLWITVWLIGILGSVYAIFGGLRTVAVSDTINGFGLLVGGVLIAYFGLRTVAGDGGTFVDGWNTLREAMPEKFNSVGKSNQHVPFATLFTGVFLLHVFYWCTNQQIIQRTLGASSLREGQKGVLIAASMKVLAPIIIVVPGMIAAYLYADSVKPDHAYGTLVREVLPPSLVGFFAAAIVGAVLSTYNSVLNSTATLFSLGVYQKHINPGASSEQIIRSGKWCGAGVALFAMLTAPLLQGQPDGIFDYLAKMNGLYSIPIFAVVLVGILSKYVPAMAAKVALVFGVFLIAMRYFVLDELDGVFEVVKELHIFHFLGIVFAVLVALMLVIGRMSPRSEAYEQQYSGDVDMTPWPWAKLAGACIVLVVLSIYAYFADLSVLGQ